jgi:beta-lactamase superfamily II metal-dependent hydrolase
VLSPTAALVNEAEESDDYDHLSYVLMVTYQGKKILLGGDATKEVWEELIARYGKNLQSDVLLAPNHGSANHISKEILEVINPRLTVVSVAEGVDYAYDLYKQYGTVLSTKHYGNIQVGIVEGGQIYFRTESATYSDGWHIVPERAYNLLADLLRLR